MENAQEIIRTRRSVRTYDGRPLPRETAEALEAFAAGARNPWGVPVEFRLFGAENPGLESPVVTGAPAWAAAKVPAGPHAETAFGFSFEAFVLYAWSLGLGTVWLGGTLNRPAFARAMALGEAERMPCVTPLGYPAKKMSLRETLMRTATKADTRRPFEELFFDGDFGTPLTPEAAGPLAPLLEAVRRAPSAVNKQPWRVLRQGERFHFYKKQSRGFGGGEAGDMQRIDLGIALCHFALAAEAAGRKLRFQQEDPGLPCPGDTVYIATYAAENA